MIKDNFSIVITGEWPGAGQSTTAAALAKTLHFDRIYAGFLFRKFAHVWNLEKEHMSWHDFETKFVQDEIDLNDYPFKESDFNEQVNLQWVRQLKKAGIPEMWDKIIDTLSLRALEKPGVVVEAKVGVLLDKTGLIKPFKPRHPIYKFLLTCPPEISSHRVIKRKIINGELPPMTQGDEEYQKLIRLTTTQTIERHLNDWERYEKIYGIYRSSIYKRGIMKVSTAERTQEEVVETILNIISQKQHSMKKNTNRPA